jgi:hypothetical protein
MTVGLDPVEAQFAKALPAAADHRTRAPIRSGFALTVAEAV